MKLVYYGEIPSYNLNDKSTWQFNKATIKMLQPKIEKLNLRLHRRKNQVLINETLLTVLAFNFRVV